MMAKATFPESRIGNLVGRRTPRETEHPFALALDNIESWTGQLRDRPGPEGVRSGNYFEPGDVLFGKLRPYLAKAWASDRAGVYIGDFLCLVPRGNASSRFLSYVLRTRDFIQRAAASSYGSKMPRIEWDSFKALDVPAPAPSEQRAIADYLDHETAEIDTFIADQTQFMERWNERVQAQLDLNFEHFQEHAPLRRVLQYITSGSRGWGDFVGDVGQPFVRIANLQGNDIEADLSDLKRVTGVEEKEGSRSRISVDDLLISITADLGSVAVADDTLAGGYTSQHICLARLDKSRAIPRFVAYSMLTSQLRASIRSKSYGGTKIQLALSDVKELKVPLPSLETQLRVAEDCQRALTESSDLKRDAEQAIDLAHERRGALISAAVTGQIDVTERHKPVAEVLEDEVLERV